MEHNKQQTVEAIIIHFFVFGYAHIPTIKENEVLIRIGAYQKGVDKELDYAISKKAAMEDFMKQNPDENVQFTQTIQTLAKIAGV